MLVLRRAPRSTDGGSGEGESGYLASASDLMIGLLFVFIIMVVILSMRVSAAVKEGKKKPDPLGSMVQIIGARIKEAGIQVQVDPKSGVITLPADTLFDVGRYHLKPNGKLTLQTVREKLAAILPCYVASERTRQPQSCPENPYKAEIETIFIEGHTDNQPLNRGEYNNWHLGLDRARTVYNEISQTGMGTYRNEREQPIFGFSSYADERPKVANDLNANRRVELRFVLTYKPGEESAADTIVTKGQEAAKK